jgi:hypothetical protein
MRAAPNGLEKKRQRSQGFGEIRIVARRRFGAEYP